VLTVTARAMLAEMTMEATAAYTMTGSAKTPAGVLHRVRVSASRRRSALAANTTLGIRRLPMTPMMRAATPNPALRAGLIPPRNAPTDGPSLMQIQRGQAMAMAPPIGRSLQRPPTVAGTGAGRATMHPGLPTPRHRSSTRPTRGLGVRRRHGLAIDFEMIRALSRARVVANTVTMNFGRSAPGSRAVGSVPMKIHALSPQIAVDGIGRSPNPNEAPLSAMRPVLHPRMRRMISTSATIAAVPDCRLGRRNPVA
jgi:hypothetical protein